MNTLPILATLTVCTTLLSSFSFNALELQMTKKERHMTGIEKLTPQERAFIEQWLQKNELLYHFTAPTVSDVRNIRWMYESTPIKRPSRSKQFDEEVMPYTMSVVALFHNQAPFLKEWIEHHKQLGVDYFYLYNNLSDDGYLDVLIPYIEMGEVELIQWPVAGGVDKEAVYTHATALAQGRAKWLLNLDIDEYLLAAPKTNITQILEEHDSYSQLRIGSHALIKPHQLSQNTGNIKEVEQLRIHKR